MEMKEFLKHCTACGGNWTSMLLSGIKEVFPEYWKAMPDVTYTFEDVIKHLEFLGIKIKK